MSVALVALATPSDPYVHAPQPTPTVAYDAERGVFVLGDAAAEAVSPEDEALALQRMRGALRWGPAEPFARFRLILARRLARARGRSL